MFPKNRRGWLDTCFEAPNNNDRYAYFHNTNSPNSIIFENTITGPKGRLQPNNLHGRGVESCRTNVFGVFAAGGAHRSRRLITQTRVFFFAINTRRASRTWAKTFTGVCGETRCTRGISLLHCLATRAHAEIALNHCLFARDVTMGPPPN
jgi:hypothetical protein